MLDNVGDILRRLRERRKMPQTALAKKAGFDHSSLSRWESGVSSPSVERLNRLLEAMGVSYTELIREIAQEKGLEAPPAAADYPTDPVELIAAQALLADKQGRDLHEWFEELEVALRQIRRAFLWTESYTASRPSAPEEGAEEAVEDGEEEAQGDPAAAAEPPSGGEPADG